MDVLFEIAGETLPVTIHQVNIYFYTNGSPVDYSLKASTHGSGASVITINQTNFMSMKNNFGGSTLGVHLEFYDLGSNFYRMEITANPENCALPGIDCEFDYNEDWLFSINGLSATNDTVISIETLMYDGTVISMDPINIFYPPLLLSPENEAIDMDTSITFKWQHATSLPPPENLDYYLYVSEDEAFDNADIYMVSAGRGKNIRYAGTGILCMLLLLTGAGGLCQSLGLRVALFTFLLITSLLVLSCPISGSGDPVDPPGNGKTGPDLSKQVGGLKPGTTYYWKVRVADSDGHEAESGVWSFSTTL